MRRWWRRNRVSEDTLADADNNDTQPTVLWWERLITIVLWIFVTAFLLVTLVAVIIPDFFPVWFGVQAVEVTNPDVRQYIAQKTLWDWFGLIAIPLAIVVVGYMLNRADRAHERRLQDQRIKESREIEEKRLVENQKLEEKRLEDTRQIEQERTQDGIVKDYFDQMTELLLHHQLRESSESAEVRSVARARTLTALRGVDGERKGMIIQFLYESRLIGYQQGIERIDAIVRLDGGNLDGIKLSGAWLEGVNLKKTTLSNAILEWTNLSGADLSGARLEEAYLFGANLAEADLSKTRLPRAILEGTNLSGANLLGAELAEADLYGAWLEGADLSGAYLSGVDLSEARLSGAFITRTHLNEANLDGADLKDAILDGANLNNTNLSGVNLEGAILAGCENVLLDQLLQVESLHRAILPDYINPTDVGDLWSPPEEENTSNSHTSIQ